MGEVRWNGFTGTNRRHISAIGVTDRPAEQNNRLARPSYGFVAKFRKQVIQTSGGCLSFNAQLSGSQSEQHADEKRLADRISFG